MSGMSKHRKSGTPAKSQFLKQLIGKEFNLTIKTRKDGTKYVSSIKELMRNDKPNKK